MQVYELTDQSVNGANEAFGACGLFSLVYWFGTCMNQRTSSGEWRASARNTALTSKP